MPRARYNRKTIAYHEAGHAVVGWAIGLRIAEVTIAMPQPRSLPMMSHLDLYVEAGGKLPPEMKENYCLHECAMKWAGVVAQKKAVPSSSIWGTVGDCKQAEDFVREFYTDDRTVYSLSRR